MKHDPRTQEINCHCKRSTTIPPMPRGRRGAHDDEKGSSPASNHRCHSALFENKDYECAITLAGAAEGQLATEESKHLFHELKVRVPPEFKNEKDWTNWLNVTRDWLKHETPQWRDEWEITEPTAAIMIARAVTKFVWAYRQGTQRMDNFMKLRKHVPLFSSLTKNEDVNSQDGH